MGLLLHIGRGIWRLPQQHQACGSGWGVFFCPANGRDKEQSVVNCSKSISEERWSVSDWQQSVSDW
jgi:hypothetical protein